MKRKFCFPGRLFAVSILLTVPGIDAQPRPSSGGSFEEVIDRVIAKENALMGLLRSSHPVAETYIQDLEKDSDFGTVPKSDHYFLGKLDFSNGVAEKSFLPKSGWMPRGIPVISPMFAMRFFPEGFAQMILIDGGAFDRGHYEFEFVRREYLGDVRTYVVSVKPREGAGRGRFLGNIWIEDKGFHIVRSNGTYSGGTNARAYLHFDSWRVNAGPDLWLPAEVYTEEAALGYAMNLRKVRFKAVTRLWGYSTPAERKNAEFTNMTFEQAKDSSDTAADNSPVESRRAWEHEAENNVLDRMEKAGMMARQGGLDKILDTVVNNLVVTNQLRISPAVRTRALLTTPLETFTVGHTIVISRGLLDTLPDEASLAAILAHELAHIALGHDTDSEYAFSDRVLFDDEQTLAKFRMARPQKEEDAANEEAVRLLMASPYKDGLGKAGLFLKALSTEANRLPCLIKPLFGSRIAGEGKNAGADNVLRMAALLEKAPQLQATRTDQVAALPLGSRTRLDPWMDDLEMARTRSVPLLSAREKMPFELAPVYIHLTYRDAGAAEGSQNAAAPNGQEGQATANPASESSDPLAPKKPVH